jgi:hypothetical protein
MGCVTTVTEMNVMNGEEDLNKVNIHTTWYMCVCLFKEIGGTSDGTILCDYEHCGLLGSK